MAMEGEKLENKIPAMEGQKPENVTKHKEPSSSSSSMDSLGDDIVLEKPLKDKGPSSPPKEPQSFSIISSTGDQSPLPPGYDLNRIPSSVFASKPANGAEWSVASNESLFSIQMGNNSFTRDHAFMLCKSGELAKAEELYGSVNGSNNNNQLSPVQETENVALAASSEVQEENENTNKNKSEAPWEIESPRVVAVEAKDEVQEEKKVAPAVQPSSSSTSICVSPHSPRSDGSNHSTQSFAFPVLAPNASAKEEVKKHETPKQSPEHQPKESPAPKEVEAQPAQKMQPKASSRRWFACFYCCPSCFS